MSTYDLVNFLISGESWRANHPRYLNDFASDLGWKPSYQFILPRAESFTSGHLVVEHGLQNSALISFITRPYRFQDLAFSEIRSLVSGSYNSLVDWHIAIDRESVTFLHNRIDPPTFYTLTRPWGREQVSQLSTAAFQTLSAKHPTPNVPALDTALIRTLSFWKRALASEIPDASTTAISALFNGVILARAIEDHFRSRPGQNKPSLRELAYDSRYTNIVDILSAALTNLPIEVPRMLWDPEGLAMFDALDKATTREFVEDFYRNRFQSYFDYDFSVMSKHALSRIYEQYVSLLRYPDTDQQALFASLPIQEAEKSFGNIYTPEFIARFFAKYVRREMPLPRFQRMNVGDPACGSGIFLRTMIETKSESLFQERTTQNVVSAFQSTLGMDIDENACAAARLSLSLLSLSLIDQMPNQLGIIRDDVLSFSELSMDIANGFLDVVVANPPFVNIEHLSTERKQLVWDVLGDETKGKTDLYLAILKLSLRFLADGGFGCFVLPKNFFISNNSAPIRALLLDQAVIRCVVDLSAIRVFEDVGAYVVLLIFQKTTNRDPRAAVLAVKCTDLVGPALEDALNERVVKKAAYQVYWTNQPRPEDTTWDFPFPEGLVLRGRLSELPKLGEVADLRQGVITGADNIFIIGSNLVPKRERSIYVPLLRDRDMTPYVIPKSVNQSLIYPFDEKGPLTERRLEEEYPQTWDYLQSHRSELEKRKSVLSGKGPWWRPLWPREPSKLFCPKIVTPHIVIAPKFSLDATGRVAVSHSPYLVPKAPFSEEESLFTLAVLNSTTCFWLIAQQAHSYSRGYSRLEPATLRDVPIPAVSGIDGHLRRQIISLTKERMLSTGNEALDIERRLDRAVADAYGLSDEDREMVGLTS